VTPHESEKEADCTILFNFTIRTVRTVHGFGASKHFSIFAIFLIIIFFDASAMAPSSKRLLEPPRTSSAQNISFLDSPTILSPSRLHCCRVRLSKHANLIVRKTMQSSFTEEPCTCPVPALWPSSSQHSPAFHSSVPGPWRFECCTVPRFDWYIRWVPSLDLIESRAEARF
jgi:hypothetical protein